MDKIIDWLVLEFPKYWKTAIATVPVVVYVGNEVVEQIGILGADGELTMSDAYKVIFLGATAYGVFRKRNRRLED